MKRWAARLAFATSWRDTSKQRALSRRACHASRAKPASVSQRSGPGVTNVVTALADAKLDSIPLVCIAGQVPQSLIGTDAFQEVPTLDMVRPITKASFFVRNASELWHVIPEAFRIAESGARSGADRRAQGCSAATRRQRALRPAPAGASATPRPLPCSTRRQHFDLAAQMIHAAQRPVLYVGGGIVKASARIADIRALAERAGLPVTSTLMALGALPAGHELGHRYAWACTVRATPT